MKSNGPPAGRRGTGVALRRVEAGGNVGMTFNKEGHYATADGHPHIEVKRSN